MDLVQQVNNTKEKIKPNYYRRGKNECWDFIYDNKLGFHEGCIVKYVTRWREKNGIEDLLKAKTYLDDLILKEQNTNKQQ